MSKLNYLCPANTYALYLTIGHIVVIIKVINLYVCKISNKEINDDPIKNKNNNNNDLCNPSKKQTDLATAIQFLIMKQLLNDINAQTMKKFLS